MDKDKLKKYAGYAGLGFVGGLVGGFLGILIADIGMNPVTIILGGLVGGLGGYLAGVLSKKWWGALIGGCILSGLIGLILFLLLIWVVNNISIF